MGKRPTHLDNNDMEFQSLKSEMVTMNRRMEEVITILGGNSAYGVRGLRADFDDMKKDMHNIKGEVAKIKHANEQQGFLNIKYATIPQKIAAVTAFLLMLIGILQGFKTLLNH